MRILALADESDERLWSERAREKLQGVDLILSAGDIDAPFLSFLTCFTTAPIVYIHGNHDEKYAEKPPEGCICAEDRVVRVNGVRILGLGGCMFYRPGRWMLTEKEMNCIQPEKIRAFYQSEVGKGARQSENVRREWQFVLKMENFSILQGVIDLCYMENGCWVLADYKTDHIGEEELAERYKTQINLYRIALEKITGIPVSKICLYSLVMNKEIPLPVFDPEIRGAMKS